MELKLEILVRMRGFVFLLSIQRGVNGIKMNMTYSLTAHSQLAWRMVLKINTNTLQWNYLRSVRPS